MASVPGNPVRQARWFGLLVWLGLLKLIAVLVIHSAHPSIAVGGDAADYLYLSQLIHGTNTNWYGNEYLIRAPGYPALLAGLRFLGIDAPAGFLVLNCVMATATALLFFDIGRRIFGETAGIIAGVIVSLDPTVFLYQAVLLTETCFAFLIALFTWLLARLLLWSGDRLRFIVSTAAALGIVTLCALGVRHVMMLFPYFLVALVGILWLAGQVDWRRAAAIAVLVVLPVVAGTQAWSQFNSSTLGINAIRELGTHLYLWRGPAILARATGEDRWELRDQLAAAIPDEIRTQPNERDKYQRDRFLEIIAEHPGAFAQDAAIGALKVLFAPPQARLQLYFPEAFGDDITNTDFIGFSEEIGETWSIYLTRAPDYIALLILATAFLGISMLGAGLGAFQFPQATSDQKSLILISLAILGYFLVLSSSASLDARFRIPFLGHIALLAGFGLTRASEDFSDWVNQRGLRKSTTIAASILRSGNAVAYQVGALKAFRLILLPFDFLIAMLTWGGSATRRQAGPSRNTGAEAEIPIVFVTGIHRSGTTFVAQALQHAFVVSTLSNFSALFPNSPVLSRLSARPMFRPKSQGALRNYYGFSAGLFGVGDVYEVWDRWFGSDHSYPRDELAPGSREDLRSYFSALSGNGKYPVLAKNNRLTLSMSVLAEVFPQAVFVHVARNPADVVRSVLRANEEFYGDKRFVWGLRPTPAFPRVAPSQTGVEEDDALICACRQQVGLESRIANELSELAPERVIHLRYEDVVGPQSAQVFHGAIETISQRLGIATLTSAEDLETLNANARASVTVGDTDRISTTLSAIRSEKSSE